MLKIRLKRLGAKKTPSYRVIVINSTTKREGRPVQELGYYNPKTKEMKLDKVAALDWVKETVKLSKKAQAKAQAEAEAKAAAEAEAAQAPEEAQA